MDRQLYHYTSLETLFAIIKEIDNTEPNFIYFKLRATNAYFLNDLTEGRLLPMALEKLGVDKDFLSMLQSTFGFPFIVSFSEHADNLNMWRCYANEGKGIAIGLSQEEIESAADFNNKCKFDKCEYVSIDELINLLAKKGVDRLKSREDIKPLAQVLFEMLKYKDKSFCSEAEWRLHDFNIETNFRISDNLVIPYREIKIPYSAIRTITIGPKSDFDRNQFSIHRMLKAKLPAQHDIRILKSDVPLA